MEHSELIVKSQDRPTDKKSDVNESALKEKKERVRTATDSVPFLAVDGDIQSFCFSFNKSFQRAKD